jgi:hypothetical protein
VRERPPPEGVAPPAELVSYTAWCAARGIEPYGDPDDQLSMRLAVGQWQAWEGLRLGWELRHARELEMDDGCDMPFDADAICPPSGPYSTS